MGLSKNIGTYQDVDKVLRAAIKAGGAVYEVSTKSAALHWRHRAYRYRTLLADIERNRLQDIPGIAVSTPFDGIILKVENNKIIIEVVEVKGKLTTIDGKSLEVEEPEPLGTESLMDLAQEVIDEFNIDDSESIDLETED